MMDCKHEKGIKIDWDIECLVCKGCGVHVADDMVIILTKPQHQLMQDVIDAVDGLINNLSEDEIEIARECMGNTNANIILHHRRVTAKALDNLEGEK